MNGFREKCFLSVGEKNARICCGAFLMVDIGARVVGGVGDNGLYKTSPRDKADPKVGQVVCLITCPAHNSLKHNLSTCLSLFLA